MGQTSSKSKPQHGKVGNQDDQHYCSIQIGQDNSFGLSIAEIQRQFGQTYIYFTIPPDKIERVRHEWVDIRYQRNLGRKHETTVTDDVIKQLDRLQDSLKISLRDIKPSKNIINKKQYLEYRVTSEKHNYFTFRFSTEGKPTLTISYIFQHS
jgi:hypothetical protein